MKDALLAVGWIDWVALVVALILVVRGFVRGCSVELAQLISLVVAIATAYFCFAPLLRMINATGFFVAHAYAAHVVTFMVLFVIGLALWYGLGRLLTSGLQLVVAQPFDRILGGVIGGMKAIAVVAILCVCGLMSPRASDHHVVVSNSRVGKELAPWITHFSAPAKVEKTVDAGGFAVKARAEQKEKNIQAPPARQPDEKDAKNSVKPPFQKSTKRVERTL